MVWRTPLRTDECVSFLRLIAYTIAIMSSLFCLCWVPPLRFLGGEAPGYVNIIHSQIHVIAPQRYHLRDAMHHTPSPLRQTRACNAHPFYSRTAVFSWCRPSMSTRTRHAAASPR